MKRNCSNEHHLEDSRPCFRKWFMKLKAGSKDRNAINNDEQHLGGTIMHHLLKGRKNFRLPENN